MSNEKNNCRHGNQISGAACRECYEEALRGPDLHAITRAASQPGEMGAGVHEPRCAVCGAKTTDPWLDHRGCQQLASAQQDEREAAAQFAKIDAGLDFEPDEQHTIADMANVGRALMKAIETHLPDYSWMQCPSEIVGDLCNELDEARAAQHDAIDEAIAAAMSREQSGGRDREGGAENTPLITANSAENAPGTLPYPTEPTDALLEVLGLMLYTTTPIAHALRAAGTDIPKRCEEEQAYVLHWLIQLALQHGAEWRARAGESIEELQAATQAASEVRA